jgi:hypothetical protein
MARALVGAASSNQAPFAWVSRIDHGQVHGNLVRDWRLPRRTRSNSASSSTDRLGREALSTSC